MKYLKLYDTHEEATLNSFGNTVCVDSSDVHFNRNWIDEGKASGEYVDLGLSVNWAKYNLGAFEENAAGEYFKWASLTQDVAYYESGSLSSSVYTKYNNSDRKTVLDSYEDPSTVYLGPEWHTPTEEEIEELHKNTTITNLGNNVYKFTSNIAGYTDKYIIVKCATWSSTVFSGFGTAFLLEGDQYNHAMWRYQSYNIRPVRVKK